MVLDVLYVFNKYSWNLFIIVTTSFLFIRRNLRFFLSRDNHTTRCWLATATLLLAILCHFSAAFIIDRLLIPSADFNKNGWNMHFYKPAKSEISREFTAFLKGGETLTLHSEYTRAKGYLIWDVPAEGKYCFNLIAGEDATLSVDGKKIAGIKTSNKPRQRVDEWISLSAGKHLFHVDLHNHRGSGQFSVGMMVPPMMYNRSLEGNDIAEPQQVNLDLWWNIIKSFYILKIFSAVFFCITLLSLLLPSTLKNRPFAVVIFIGIAVIPAFLIPARVHREPYIGEMIHKQLQTKNPDFVFIGNSMLWSRIDDTHMEKLLGNKKVFSIVNFGGLSAIHYLSFKYLLVPANISPKKVFIFFRSNQFHLPRMRTTDSLVKKTVQRLTPSPDPVYENLVHGRSRTPTEIIYDTLLNLFPVASLQDYLREYISSMALHVITIQADSNERSDEKQEILRVINDRFSYTKGDIRSEKNRETEDINAVKNAWDFNAGLDTSFLPYMLDIAKTNNLSLVFIRVQERPGNNDIVQDPPIVKKYMNDLQLYLNDNGASFYDFTGDPELPLSAYHDGDHIRDQKKYTELFVRRLGDMLQ